MTLWFSSDHHIFHKNIIEYGKRPFKDVEEMNEVLIERHNALVKPSDHWTCLGDFVMGRDNQGRELGILQRMNGHKRLILGIHDHYAMKHYLIHFEKVMAMNRIDNMWFMHVPCHPMNIGSAKAIIHGHIHQNASPPPVMKIDKNGKDVIIPYVNISVEVTDYRPLSLEEIKERVEYVKLHAPTFTHIERGPEDERI